MAINKLITSEGNVQFIFGDTGKIINVHPFHIYTTFNEDTVSFILIGLPKSSGLAIFTSKAEDLEVNGEICSFDDLPDALADAFAIAGAQMRYEVVDELPETGQTNTIYLVPKQGGSGFDEYIYVRDTGEWELIGDTDIELARYMKKEDFNAYSAATKLKIDYISGATDYVSGAVDTEISRATSAETELQTAIDNEASARTSADTALQTAIDNEVSARTEADSALSDKIDYVSGAVDTEVSARGAADNYISGAVDTLSSVKADKADAVASAVYVSSSTTIDLKNISGEVISQVDASDFIVDGMVEDVRIENGYLIIDFNTASGIEDIEIPLTDIFNPANYYDKTAIDGIVSGINDSIADEVSARTDADAALQTNIDNEISARTEAISGLTDRLGEDEEVWGAALNELNASISAVNDSFSAYSTTVEMTEEITAAVSGKQDTLIAGDNITISGNVISATGGGGEVSSAITSGDTNAVAGGVLWDELRLPTEGESGLTLEWELYDGGSTINYPSGQSSKITIYTDVSMDGGNGYYFRNSGDEDLGFIQIVFEDDTAYVYDQNNCTYTMSGNVITVEYPSIAANVDHIYSVYDNYWTTIAYISTTTMIPLIDQVSANTATLASLEENVNENEEVTSAGLNALNDKFGGLKLMKITQAAYDALTVKDNNTLYIISD